MDAVGTAYEGLLPRFTRIYLQREPESFKGRQREAFERIVARRRCPACGGSRLAEPARDSLIAGNSIADCNAMQVDELLTFIRSIGRAEVAPLLSILGELQTLVDLPA